MEMGENKTCQLCLCSEDNELKYGKLFEREGLVVHHFCLLFAPSLPQNGDDDHGIEGFMPEDIKQEIKRVRPLKCCYCKQKGANLGCENVKHLAGAYHMNCAWDKGVAFEFTSSFLTYCPEHRIRKLKKPTPTVECGICFEKFGRQVRSILMPCCKNTWFHRDCLQQYAMNAGVFFKCPLCGDKSQEEQLKQSGIFFPNRDALWELEPEAFSEFTQPLQVHCESKDCPNKTRNVSKPYKWKLCNFCGANGIHIKCLKGSVSDTFTCSECQHALTKMEREAKFKRQRTWISDEEVLSDDENEERTEKEPVSKKKKTSKKK